MPRLTRRNFLASLCATVATLAVAPLTAFGAGGLFPGRQPERQLTRLVPVYGPLPTDPLDLTPSPVLRVPDTPACHPHCLDRWLSLRYCRSVSEGGVVEMQKAPAPDGPWYEFPAASRFPQRNDSPPPCYEREVTGGFLVPPEFQDALIRAIKRQEGWHA